MVSAILVYYHECMWDYVRWIIWEGKKNGGATKTMMDIIYLWAILDEMADIANDQRRLYEYVIHCTHLDCLIIACFQKSPNAMDGHKKKINS